MCGCIGAAPTKESMTEALQNVICYADRDHIRILEITIPREQYNLLTDHSLSNSFEFLGPYGMILVHKGDL